MDIGMTETEREEVAKHLSFLLADTYSIYLKTQNFHWNLQGENFYGLHILMQKLYEDLAEGVDEIAERIRSLGQYVVANFSHFQKITQIQGEEAWVSAKNMIQTLTDDHQKIAKEYRPVIEGCQKLRDEMSADLLIKRISFHEKAAYLLSSHLG